MHPVSFAVSDLGQSREKNEDAVSANDETGLYIVCDGMGGHEGGEIASQVACQTAARIVEAYEGSLSTQDGLQQAVKLIERAIKAANDAVREKAHESEKEGMGTTMTLLLLGGRRAVLGHVGDSRLYLLRTGALHMMTTDHTGAEELVRSGNFTEEQARESPLANMLTRAVGRESDIEVDTLLFDVLPDDRFLLCSDGLTRYVYEREEIAQGLSGDVKDVAAALVEKANAGGGRDNISAVVVHLEPDENDRTVHAWPQIFANRVDAVAAAFHYEQPRMRHMQRILNRCHETTLDPGQVVFGEGETIDQLIIVDEGKLEVVPQDGEVSQLVPGDVAGRRGLTNDAIARATLRAAGPAKVLVLKKEDFWKMIWRHPIIGIQVLGHLAGSHGPEPI